MRRLLFLGVLFLTTGCSTAPITGLMDCLSPSKSGSSPDYPPRPSDRDPLPDRLPPPQIPSPDVPSKKQPIGEPSARLAPATETPRRPPAAELPPKIEPADMRILPP